MALCVVLVCNAACSAAEGKAAMAVKITRSDDTVVMDNGIVSVNVDTKAATFSARTGDKTFITNGLERLIEVREQNQGETYVTHMDRKPGKFVHLRVSLQLLD